MRHRTNKSNILVAGAWYRILKNFAVAGSIAIIQNLDLSTSESAKFQSIINKIDELETSIGFDKLAERYFGSEDLLNIFYGSIGVKARNDVDKQVKQNISEILSDWLEISRDGDAYDCDTKERMRIINESDR